MTEEFINDVINNYSKWLIKRAEERDLANKKINRLKQLLTDEKVKEFASLTEFDKSLIETNNVMDLSTLSMFSFLKNYMSKKEFNLQSLKNDRYPIYCYIESRGPIRTLISGKQYLYKDYYCSLQNNTYIWGPSDKKENGKNRSKFIEDNKNRIIYPEENHTFDNPDYFYKVQTEYIKYTLLNNQEEARKLILNKYNKKSSN